MSIVLPYYIESKEILTEIRSSDLSGSNLILSDSFEHKGKGCLELTVRVININYGHNPEFMRKCRSLSDYARFVNRIRKNMETMSMEEAARNAVEECIAQNILKDFLTVQKAEVIAMSIYEYNEEYVKKTIYEDGVLEGIMKGKAAERAAMVASIKKMCSKGFSPEETADLLDQEKKAVEQILALIAEDPQADNLTIARKAVERESQTEKAGIHIVED